MPRHKHDLRKTHPNLAPGSSNSDRSAFPSRVLRRRTDNPPLRSLKVFQGYNARRPGPDPARALRSATQRDFDRPNRTIPPPTTTRELRSTKQVCGSPGGSMKRTGGSDLIRKVVSFAQSVNDDGSVTRSASAVESAAAGPSKASFTLEADEADEADCIVVHRHQSPHNNETGARNDTKSGDNSLSFPGRRSSPKSSSEEVIADDVPLFSPGEIRIRQMEDHLEANRWELKYQREAISMLRRKLERSRKRERILRGAMRERGQGSVEMDVSSLVSTPGQEAGSGDDQARTKMELEMEDTEDTEDMEDLEDLEDLEAAVGL